LFLVESSVSQDTAATRYIHCNTLQQHCNTLQHAVTHCNTLQHAATHCNTLQLTITHCNTLQHTATVKNLELRLQSMQLELSSKDAQHKKVFGFRVEGLGIGMKFSEQLELSSKDAQQQK